MEKTKIEKVQGIVIIILSFIIVLGGAYFTSELKYCKTETVKEKELTKINMQKFYELLAGKESSVVYLARPGCSWCQQQQPIVQTISGEYDLVFNYLNTEELTQDDLSKIFALSTKVFGKDGSEFGTPTVLIVKDGKIIDSSIGFMQKEQYIEFLQKNSLINKK